MKIGILGAGVGGLSVAIALKQKGFEVEIYERHRKQASIGAGIVCWPNGAFVLSKLGILEKISDISGKPAAMRRIFRDGEFLGALDINIINRKMGYPSLSILRKDLMATLEARALELGIHVQYGREVEQLIPGAAGQADIRFCDGSVAEADLIIGADGRMNSMAREFVNGDNKPIFQKFINWIGTIETEDQLFEEISVYDYWGVGERFGIVPISAKKAYWAGGAFVSNVGERSPEHYKYELLSRFENWPDPVPRIIRESNLSKINKVYVHDHNPIDTWHKENVLLIGDAAHAPLPTSGQGACQALEDAWLLAETLEDNYPDVSVAIKRFSEHRYSKTKNIINSARQLARSLFNADPEYCAKRNMTSKQADFNAMAIGMSGLWSQGLPLHS